MTQKRRDTSGSIPASVRLHGALGYTAVPTELVWTKHVCKALEEQGVKVVVNVGSIRVSSVTDRSWITGAGTYWVEFKGPKTPVKENQALFMEHANRVSTSLGSGLCAFVYRYPGYIESPRGDLQLGPVEAFNENWFDIVKQLQLGYSVDTRKHWVGGSLGHV